jgi:uncharacterized protein Yka (UPF0111/DUF47 family)
MLKRFLPIQNQFFDLFQKIADIFLLTASEFHLLLLDLAHCDQHVATIAAHELEADKLVHLTFGLLHKTFITPFDRHDIHQLTSKLDDCLDLINRCAQRFPIYALNAVTVEMIELAKYGEACAALLKNAIYGLNNLDNSADILKACDEIDEVENKAHVIVLAGEQNLYLHENDFKQFFKLKEVYTRTKDVINKCQDVSNIIKGIVLEYS